MWCGVVGVGKVVCHGVVCCVVCYVALRVVCVVCHSAAWCVMVAGRGGHLGDGQGGVVGRQGLPHRLHPRGELDGARQHLGGGRGREGGRHVGWVEVGGAC